LEHQEEELNELWSKKTAITTLVRSLQQAIDRSIALMKRLRADFERRKAEMKRFQDQNKKIG
jgi:peptidoglycan hydrolase CwlO-like protein